jgi:transposase
LLEQFPTPASITVLSKDVFVEAAWDLVGRKVSKTRLLGDIYETARSSMALPVRPDSAAIAMFRLVLAEGRSLLQRDQIEAQAEALLARDADAARLRQLPGIGPIIALTILAEAGDLRRFGHHRQFLKFCGFDLATHQSGMFRGQTRLPKFGNARLRRCFWPAAQVAIRQRENSFQARYSRYIAKDPGNKHLRRKAITAVASFRPYRLHGPQNRAMNRLLPLLPTLVFAACCASSIAAVERSRRRFCPLEG